MSVQLRACRDRVILVLTSLTAGLLLASASPAAAVDARVHSSERVLGGITTQHFEIRTSDGAIARGNILRFEEDDPDVDLRPRLANNSVAGTETMVTMARRERSRGAVAGVNGGYWLSRPWGAPNGLSVDRGQLLAGQAVRNSTGGGPAGRASVGWQQHGQLLMDRLLVDHQLRRPGTGLPPVRVSELNRQPLPSVGVEYPQGELLFYTDRFGTAVNAPAGAVVVRLEGIRPGSTGQDRGRVLEVLEVPRATGLSVPQGQQLVVAYGPRTSDVDGLVPGASISFGTTITPETSSAGSWDDLWGGVAGGQLLIRDGRRRSVDEWRSFAAFSDAHATGRQPRTAIARTRGGEVLLVTVDGRRPGWSVGATLRDLADALLQLGVTDAVNLDGGGSTTMTIDGAVNNRPSEQGRSVADGLFLYVALPPAARVLDQACSDELRLAGAGFVDVPATSVHAAAIECLAAWGVTRGVTASTFDPDGRVTRAQMASFLARWIDDHAERGAGTPLPDVGPLEFADVAVDDVHASAIARLAEAGIVTGTTATAFEPGAPISRAQTASLVARSTRYVTGQQLPAGRDTFVDDNGSVHEPNIDRLAASGIVSGTGGFSFVPAAPVTRAAMASLLMRASALLVELGVAVRPGTDAGPMVVEDPESPTIGSEEGTAQGPVDGESEQPDSPDQATADAS